MKWVCIACHSEGEGSEHVCGVPNNPDGNEFFFDGVLYRDPRPTAILADVLKSIGWKGPWAYQIYQERDGDEPDVPVSTYRAVDLRTKPSFYAVPPATGG